MFSAGPCRPEAEVWGQRWCHQDTAHAGVPHVHIIYSRLQGGPSGCLGVDKRGHGPSDPCVLTGGRNWPGPVRGVPLEGTLEAAAWGLERGL